MLKFWQYVNRWHCRKCYYSKQKLQSTQPTQRDSHRERERESEWRNLLLRVLANFRHAPSLQNVHWPFSFSCRVDNIPLCSFGTWLRVGAALHLLWLRKTWSGTWTGYSGCQYTHSLRKNSWYSYCIHVGLFMISNIFYVMICDMV